LTIHPQLAGSMVFTSVTPATPDGVPARRLALDELTSADIAVIATWECDERTHYFWCGTVMAFPPDPADITRHVRSVTSSSHLVRAVRVDGQIGGFIELDLTGAGHGTLAITFTPPPEPTATRPRS